MKKYILISGAIFFVACISFIFVAVNRSLYNLQDSDLLLDAGPSNPLNRDNVIFKGGRVFTFRVSIKNPEGIGQKLYLTNTLSGPASNLISDSIESIPDYVIDHIALYVNRNKGTFGIGESQTIIKYDYYDGAKKVYHGEITGVKEDSSVVFLHSPRMHFFYANQLNPFPYVRFPIMEHTYWEIDFGIPDHALEKFPNLKDSSLKLMYSLVGQEVLKTTCGVDSVYKFRAIGKNNDIETSTLYYFSKFHGFVKIEFRDLNGYLVVMELENISESR